MGTPEVQDYAAALFDYAGKEISKLVRASVPSDEMLLDIGAGWMKYRILLSEYELDAVEVWRPYVDRLRLRNFYRQVYVMEAEHFVYPQRYGAVILGDVLEHMSVAAAQRVIADACANADHVFVAVPFLMPQHEEEGNPYEIHVQEDLTEEVMRERYPQLALFGCHQGGGHAKAIYTKV